MESKGEVGGEDRGRGWKKALPICTLCQVPRVGISNLD